MPEFLWLQEFHFLRPWWLAGILGVLVAAWLMGRAGHRPGSWHQVIAPELLPFLMDAGETRSGNIRPWFLLAGLISCLALAGPTWSKKEVNLHRQDQPLIVLFDLSPSMMATDVTPNRLTRARLKTIDLLEGYEEGSSALIAFAGEAHAVTPITDDANTIISQLPVLNPDVMPVAGSNPESALRLALELAENAGYDTGDVLLVTDGVTPDARENLEAMLRRHPQFRLSILGVGTDEGAPIPLNEHGFARDSRGGIVIARLRSAELAGLAQRSGGVYQTLASTDRDIAALLSPLTSRSSAEAADLERRLDIWEDRGIWLVYLLLVPALLLFRRGLVFCVLVVPLLHSPESEAGLWDDLWQRRDQQALEKLTEGHPEDAAQLFKDPQWQGVARYRDGDYLGAAEAFGKGDSATAHYNRGNALARAGELEKALEAYDQALERDPAMADASHNRKVVEELLRQQQQDQERQQNQENGPQQEQQEGQQQGQGQDGSESGEGAQSAERENTPDQPGETPGPGDPGGGSAADAGQREEQSGEEPPHDAPGEGQQGAPNEQQAGSESPKPSPGEEEDPENGAATSPPQPGSATDGPVAEDSSSAALKEGQMTEEERQSAEQWLRRVPDDPGGLLRRKFDYESRQRFREERSNVRPSPDNYAEERW